jgi:hypothetical protein
MWGKTEKLGLEMKKASNIFCVNFGVPSVIWHLPSVIRRLSSVIRPAETPARAQNQ